MAIETYLKREELSCTCDRARWSNDECSPARRRMNRAELNEERALLSQEHRDDPCDSEEAYEERIRSLDSIYDEIRMREFAEWCSEHACCDNGVWPSEEEAEKAAQTWRSM